MHRSIRNRGDEYSTGCSYQPILQDLVQGFICNYSHLFLSQWITANTTQPENSKVTLQVLSLYPFQIIGKKNRQLQTKNAQFPLYIQSQKEVMISTIRSSLTQVFCRGATGLYKMVRNQQSGARNPQPPECIICHLAPVSLLPGFISSLCILLLAEVNRNNI